MHLAIVSCGSRYLLAAAAVLLAMVTPMVTAAQTPADTLADRAAAARDTFPLREIVVTATRLPLPRHAVPASVTVITGEELRARGVRFVADALRLVPGVSLVQAGSRGGLTALFMRGGEADYVRVLIDGVTINEPGGALDLAGLSTADVARIEVVRGPASVLYGTDAVSGVVQIFTRAGSGPVRVRAGVEGGRNAWRGTADHETADGTPVTLALDVSLDGRIERVQYGFAAARYRTDGLLAINNEFEQHTLSGRVRWSAPAPRPREVPVVDSPLAGDGETLARSEAVLSARWSDRRYHFPTDGAGRIVDLNQFSTGSSLALGAELGHRVSPALELRGVLAAQRGATGFDDQPDGPADTLGFFASTFTSRVHRRSIDVRANAHLGSRTIITTGAATEWQLGSTVSASDSEFGAFSDAAHYDRHSRAGYAQLVSAAVAPLTVTAGGRLEHSRAFGTFITYRVGANVRVAPAATLRAAAGTAFKEPTFFENFAEGFVIGNPDLRPERSRSAEVGVLGEAARGAASLTLFRQRFRDMIQFDGRPAEQRAGASNYFNLAAAAADGIELDAHVRAGELLLRVAYTYLTTNVTNAGTGGDAAFRAGSRLLRRPAHTANASVRARLAGQAMVSADARYAGRRDDLDFRTEWSGQRVILPAHAIVGAAAELPLWPERLGADLALTIRVENVFDERYEEVAGFPARGRALFIGVRMANARED